jgi:pimeloyl-ACP methyl ester carboxylesterase
VLAALVVVCTACGGTDSASGFGGRVFRHTVGSDVPGGSVPTTISGGDFSTPGYSVIYTPMPCPFSNESDNGLTIDCGTLKVPMNRSKLSEGSISLMVARIHSTSPTPAPDPVVYLEGGPGGSALASIDEWTKPASPILADRDLILLDQRGTGYSTPSMTCDELQDTDYSDDVAEITSKCVAVMRNKGVDLSAFNTTENAADVADLRKALKIPQWNLYGISYGTRLALWTMQTHPEGIRSVLIDSVYEPTVAGWNSMPADLDRAITAVAADCAAQPACNRAFPDIPGQLNSAIDKMNRGFDGTDLKLGDSEGAQFIQELFHALYQTLIMPDIPKAISLANQGNLSGAYRLLEGEGALARHPELRKDAPPDSAYYRPELSDMMNSAVECAETQPQSTPTSIRTGGGAVPHQVSDGLVAQLLRQFALCQVLAVPAKPLGTVHSDIPTLTMAGTYDPITPPAWGQLAAQGLTHARFQTVVGSGHGASVSGPCAEGEAKQFFDDPNGPLPDCTGAPPAFTL